MSNKCPRCDNHQLRRWEELNDDEREVVKRLPAAASFQSNERQSRHRWCTRCWYEQTHGEQRA